MKLLHFLKQYYFYIFAILLFLAVSTAKFFPNILAKNNPTLKADENVAIDTGTTATTSSSFYIDLSGAVERPGVYEMPAGSRVSDILKVGGGFSSNASALWISRNINLSKLLVDTQKIYIPYEWETYEDCSCKIDTLSLNIPNIPKGFGGTSVSDKTSSDTPDETEEDTTDTTENSGFSDSSKVNVNTASVESLDSLSGIGPTYAKKIADNRPYTNLEELVSKSGIPKSVLEKISNLITY